MVDVRRLVWAPLNVAHTARHGVSPDEVEEVCHGDPEDLRSYLGRIILIGPTRAGRMLAVMLEPEGEGTYYPITARHASRKERRYYQGRKGGQST
jgi:uncharacterized DUF497 family protein